MVPNRSMGPLQLVDAGKSLVIDFLTWDGRAHFPPEDDNMLSLQSNPFLV